MKEHPWGLKRGYFCHQRKMLVNADGSEIKKPKPPRGKVLREGDPGPYCEKCGGSQKWRKFLWVIRTSPYGCMTRGCDNYSGHI